jgi:hypothetical protein
MNESDPGVVVSFSEHDKIGSSNAMCLLIKNLLYLSCQYVARDSVNQEPTPTTCMRLIYYW